MNAKRIAPLVAVLLLLPSALTFAGTYSGAPEQDFTSESINDYMSNGWSEDYQLFDPMLGITLREEQGRLAAGVPILGLGVMAVSSGGPADHAGINAPHTVMRDAAVAVLALGGLVFPPAMLGAVMVAQTGVGDSHDLLVAVDGYRIHNLFQFESAMRMARPGEIVYLRVIRSGERHEVRIPIPPGAGLGLSY